MARPRVRMPAGYREKFLDLAEQGLLKERIAAAALGMTVFEFRAVLKHNAAAREAWEDALAVERDRILEAMYRKALEGDTKAAAFILQARHGMTTEPKDKSPGVNITFALPAAMTPEQYRGAIVRDALPHGTAGAQS